jgi:CRISPR-associated protein Cmr6
MSYRGSNTQNRFPRSSDDRKTINLGWIDEISNRFVTERWAVGIPNLFSLTNISSLKINSLKIDSPGKSEALVRKLIERLTQYSSRADLSRVNKHLNQIKQAYSSLKFPVLDLEAKLTYKGLVGASSSFGQLAFQVGLSFDPLLNVPYVPGSSIKGAVKAASRLKNVIPDDELLGELFGNNSVGRLDFSDAYPVEGGVKEYILIPDVLTPHYSKGGEDILGEDQVMPTPIPFLSIAPATKFRFLIADRAQKADQPFLETLLKAVAVAFSLGVGAKTALGYGTFELIKASVEKGGQDA